MAGIFGNGAPTNYGGGMPQSFPQMTNYGMTPTQGNPNGNILVYTASSREMAEQHQLAANTTAVFLNYSGRKMWIKTEHANGLAYDMEEFILFLPTELQQYVQQIQSQVQSQQPIQSGVEYVPRSEFEELKKQFEEFIK